MKVSLKSHEWAYRNIETSEKNFPDSPLVVIDRPEEESFCSYLNAFRWFYQHLLASAPSKVSTAIAIWKRQEAALECLEKMPGALVVNFNELSDNEVVGQVWKHCIPDIEPDNLRIAQLQDFRVTVMYENLELNEMVNNFINKKIFFDDKLFGQKTERSVAMSRLQKLWLKFVGNEPCQPINQGVNYGQSKNQ